MSALPGPGCVFDRRSVTLLRACPICSNPELRTLHRFTVEQAAQAFLPRARDEARYNRLCKNIEELWAQDSCEIVQCCECNFSFPVPYVGGDREFYELAYGTPSYPSHRWEYDRALDFLKTACDLSSPRLLELGAGDGQFMKMLLKDIPAFKPGRIVATDYSSHSVNELKKLGVDARQAGVFEIASCRDNRAAFSAVCAFQSIEHMADIAEVAEALRTLLCPGGLLILSVPNGRAIEFNEQHLSCFDMPPNHVGRWYKGSFDALTTRAGLSLIAHEIEPKRLPRLLRDAVELCVHGVAASKPQSLAGRAQTIESRWVRRLASAVVGMAVLLPRLPAVWRLDSGHSQMAVFRFPKTSY